MATYNHYYELPVYKVCRDFRKFVSSIAKEFLPKYEDYHLKTQLLDAVRSVTANIAEGFGRYHYQENIQFCRQSRGSLSETMEHIVTAYDERYITEIKLKEANEMYKKMSQRIEQLYKISEDCKGK